MTATNRGISFPSVTKVEEINLQNNIIFILNSAILPYLVYQMVEDKVRHPSIGGDEKRAEPFKQ